MGQPLTVPPPGFDELSVEEQIEYVNALWDRIAALPGAVPLPAWHIEVLDERLAEADADPQDTVPWDQVKADLQNRVQRSK